MSQKKISQKRVMFRPPQILVLYPSHPISNEICLFVKLLSDQPEGKYVIMRDPNRAIVRIYGVPMETFEESDDESEEDDEEGEGED